MTTTFIGVRHNKRADGYLVVGLEIFAARSGRNLSDVSPAVLQNEASKKGRKLRPGEHKYIDYAAERGDVPPGSYEISQPWPLTADNRLTMSPPNSDPSRFRKFGILPVGRSGTEQDRWVYGVPDERYATRRDHLLFHFDGDVIGSAGCIVYDDERVQGLLETAYASHDRSVRVIHVATAQEALAKAQETLAAKQASAGTT